MIQISIVFVYVILTVLISYASKNKSKTARSFEGTGLGLLLCVVAGAGEWLGGTATTGIAEYGYLYGLSGAWYTIANGLGICFLAIFFAKMFRALDTPTVSGIIGKYLGKNAKISSAILLILIMLVIGMTPVVALGTMGETLFGFEPNMSILIMGLIVLCYTVFGGMMAVGYTNILHLVVMYTGAILAVFLCGKEIGGLDVMRSALPETHFSVSSIGIPKISSWIIASVLGACTAQAGLQPVLAAKDETTAKKSSFYIAALVAPFGIFTAILGMIARIKFPGIENTKLVLPTLLLSMDSVSGGFIMASVFAAILSTIAPIFLSVGTLFTRDIYQETKWYKNNSSDKKLLRVSRIATLIGGLICIGASLLFAKSSTILDMIYFGYSLRAGLFIILILGVLWKKTSPKGAITAMVLTGITGIVWIVCKKTTGTYPIHPYFSETYVSVLVAFVSTVIISMVHNRMKVNTLKNKEEGI